MNSYFYCTRFINKTGDQVYSNGVIQMKAPSLDELRAWVTECAAKDGHEVIPRQLVVLAFNRI